MWRYEGTNIWREEVLNKRFRNIEGLKNKEQYKNT
jgi:hypothetical protein